MNADMNIGTEGVGRKEGDGEAAGEDVGEADGEAGGWAMLLFQDVARIRGSSEELVENVYRVQRRPTRHEGAGRLMYDGVEAVYRRSGHEDSVTKEKA